jgi:hypothetical protein
LLVLLKLTGGVFADVIYELTCGESAHPLAAGAEAQKILSD